MWLCYHIIMKVISEIDALRTVLNRLKKKGKVVLAYLYGSFASGRQHKRSDIDLAIYLNVANKKEEAEIIDRILMAVEKPVEILRLDDEDESPFVVQEALKGIPLIEPDMEALYRVSHRALHETEGIRYRRSIISRQL